MTRISALHQHLIRPSFVGFDNLFNEIERLVEGTQPAPSFPPHNILKVNDNNYVVELAVAGFSKDEIIFSDSIRWHSFHESWLSIPGNQM